MSTILVIDDIKSELELLGHYLKQEGHTVVCTSDVREGIDTATNYEIDAIVADVVMPGMSGFELCRHLKASPVTSSVPIIFCTSKDRDIDRLWAMKQGADAYLTKPVTQKQLVRAVESVVS
ncbi:response regulator transcription factor [Synechococcus sp. PCC 7336]|uniref:response regulator transcription factor n=1 Tax=Synechococcus sp. PCC 7336 TaxID=195250 RepID=UPI0003481AD8|nr:response regulator [Synechococcus sp. PCC 7336]